MRTWKGWRGGKTWPPREFNLNLRLKHKGEWADPAGLTWGQNKGWAGAIMPLRAPVPRPLQAPVNSPLVAQSQRFPKPLFHTHPWQECDQQRACKQVSLWNCQQHRTSNRLRHFLTKDKVNHVLQWERQRCNRTGPSKFKSVNEWPLRGGDFCSAAQNPLWGTVN